MINLTEQQLADVRTQLSEGDKIAAVKSCMTATGCGLLEAKKFVESLLSEQPSADPHSGRGTSSSGNIANEVMDEILDHLAEGQKLQAIKVYRNASGKPLRESKVFVEQLIDELGIELPEPKGCSAAVLLILAFGVSSALSLAS